MYCQHCAEERGPQKRFCIACGGPLESRPREVLERDLGQNVFLVDALEQWEKRGELTAKFVNRLAEPYRSRIERLEAALVALGSADPLKGDADVPRVLPVPVHVVPSPRVDSGWSREVDAPPQPQAFLPPPPVNVVVPEPAPVHAPRAADDAIALASGVLEGPLSLADVEAPPPAPLEVLVERESSWSKVWKPFLYDNAIWFVGAFCIVSGSLYVASQAYTHVGDVARSLLVMGMMLAYAGGFGAAGFWLDARKGLQSAGRILSLIGASVAPVALFTIEPLRAASPVTFCIAALGSLIAATVLLRAATDRFDPRLSLRVAATGAVLMAWELLVPLAFHEPALSVLVPLGALLSATPLLRPREPAVERPSQAFASLMLLYLAAFDLARLHFLATPTSGLELYGPVATALGWIALRADRARLGPSTEDKPRLEATSLAALALVVCGGLCSLVGEASAGAAALLATLAFADAARTYKRAPFIAVAAFLGLFAYYLSPDLIPHGVTLVLAAAKRALGYPPGESLPFAYAGVSTVPYLIVLGVLARRAHARGQDWIARPLGFTGLAVAVLLTAVAHSSPEVRPGLWSSLALVALAGAALWLAEHQAAGYLFGYVAAILGYDVARALGADGAGVALGLAASALAIGVVARAAPERQRQALVGEALVLAVLVPIAACSELASPLVAWALGAGAAILVLLALETRSRLPAFLAALELCAAGAALLTRTSPHALLAPGMLGLAFIAVVLAGRAFRAAEASSVGVRPFGMSLPWQTTARDLFRDPLALLGAGTTLVALAPLIQSLPTLTLLARGELVAAAVVSLLLARRYASGHATFATVLLGALACLGEAPAFGLLGLGFACVAVAFTRWPSLARLALRSEGSAATLAFGLAAVLLPLGVVVEGGNIWLVASAVSMLLLLRWMPAPALWLPLAALCGWWASSPWNPPITGHVSAAIVLALAALGLLSRERPRLVERLLGVDGDSIPPVVTWVVGLGTLLALGELIGVAEQHVAARAVLPLALLAGAHVLLARQTENAVPLFLGFAFGFGAAVCLVPEHQLGIYLIGAVGLALLANVVRVVSGLAEWTFGVYPARSSGYAFGLLALLMLAMPVLVMAIFDVNLDSLRHVYPLVGAGVIFLAARALGWAPLQPVAIGLTIAELIARSSLKHDSALPLLAEGVGALMLTLAVLTRRSPGLLTLIFLDRPPEKGRADTLRVSMLVAFGLTLIVAPWLAATGDKSEGLIGLVVGLGTLLLALAPLGAPGPAWWVGAAAFGLGGSLLVHADGSFRATFIAAQVLLGIAGLLQLRPVRRAIQAAFAATDVRRTFPRRLGGYRRAFSGVVTWSLLAAGLVFSGTLFQRLDTHHAIVDAARWVSLFLPLTGLHLIFRRRTAPTLALFLALPLLPVAYLVPGPLLAVALALFALPLALVAWLLPLRQLGRNLTRVGLTMSVRLRTDAAKLSFMGAVGLTLVALWATELDLTRWQTPATAGLLTAALVVASLRQKLGRTLALALLPATAHLGLAWLGVQLSTGRPHAAILGAWALAAAALALGAEWVAGDRETRADLRIAAHLYALLGAAELIGAMALMPGMKPSELLLAGLAAALLGGFALRRALATGRELYAYLAQAALVAVYLLVRLQTEFVGHRGDRDALSTVVLGFAFLGLHALAQRMQSKVFERPTRVVTHVLPLLGLLFVPGMTASQGTVYGLGLALHYAAVSGATGGSKLAATLSAVALNGALAVTWIDRGIADPQFYAIPFGATLLAFARIFRSDLSERARFGLRTAGILCVYVASATSALYFASPGYVLVCAGVCVVGVLLGVALRVKAYVYLGSAFLVVDVLGNMARFGLRQPFFGGLFLTLLGFALVGGWIFFVSKREELVRRYLAVQTLLADWE
jgi:hypothetical protein